MPLPVPAANNLNRGRKIPAPGTTGLIQFKARVPMEYFIQQLINGIALGSIYGLIAIGYTMVYGIIGMINFAHGDVFMTGGFIAMITFLEDRSQGTVTTNREASAPKGFTAVESAVCLRLWRCRSRFPLLTI